MNEQVYTLLDELKKYRDTEKKHQDENYFTEILKWYLNNVDYFRKEFLNIIKLSQMIDARFESQVRLYGKNGYMDLFAETQNEVVIIENKIDSSVSDGQLEKYFKDVQERINIENKIQKINLCLITKRHFDLDNKAKSLFQDVGIEPICITWQSLYDELAKNIDAQNRNSTLWKLLDSYFISSGLLRRRPLTTEMYKNKPLLKGQCISMMDDLANDPDNKINELFTPFREMFSITDYPSKQTIEYHWGRIGLNLRQANSKSSKNWWPNIFIGVVIDNRDHKIEPFNGPKVVIIVEWAYTKSRRKERQHILETWRESLYKFKNDNQCEHTIIHLNYDLENKWRFIVIEKDLIHFINNSSTKIQDNEFVEFYSKWLHKLNEELLVQSMFATK